MLANVDNDKMAEEKDTSKDIADKEIKGDNNDVDVHALTMAQTHALWHSGGATECITNYDDHFSAWKNSPAHNEILVCSNIEAAVGIYYYNGYYYSVFQCQ